MIEVMALYGRFCKPWITAVVYLWSLEFIVCFSISDGEPLFDRVADSSAILATMVFWVGIAAFVPWVTAALLTRKVICFVNDIAATVVMIAITAFFLLRWIFTWVQILGNSQAISFVLVTLVLILAGWVWCARTAGNGSPVGGFSLGEAWRYFAAPIVVLASVSLAVKVGTTIRSRENLSAAVVGSEPERANIVLVVADALRQRSMSLYGYNRKTTPFLDRFAVQSQVYTEMHVNSTSTRTSLTTVLSGKHPMSHGRLTKFQPAYESPENLVAVLRDNGYTTAAVTSNSDATFYMLGLDRFLSYGEYPNFRRLSLSFLRENGVYPTSSGMRMYDELAWVFPFLAYPAKALGYGSASDTVDIATRVLINLPEPFFLFVHFHDPHDPYEAPPPYRGKYATVARRNIAAKIPAGFYGHYERSLQPFVDAYRDHYDETIEYFDSAMEKLVQALDRKPMSKKNMLLLTSDHGESFERGFLNHGEHLYESSIHVPLVIRLPNRGREEISHPTQSTDIAPTVLEAVGIPVPKWMDGVALGTAKRLQAKDKIVVNFKDPANGKIYVLPTQLAIRRGDYKMILSCDDGATELYDLRQDPDERQNLSSFGGNIRSNLYFNLQRKIEDQANRAKLACPPDRQRNEESK
jgi:arylsulfatase A-like enzyme